MNAIKKAVTVLVAVSMLFAMLTAVSFAADNASIQIVDADYGTTYTLYKGFYLNGGKYYPVNNDVKTAAQAAGSPFEADGTDGAFKLKNELHENNCAEWFTANKSKLVQVGDPVVSGRQEPLTFSGLGGGYYFIVSNPVEGTSNEADVVVDVNSDTANVKTWVGLGTITVTNTDIGQDYSVFKIFDLTYTIADDGISAVYMTNNPGLISLMDAAKAEAEADGKTLLEVYDSWHDGEPPVCPFVKGAEVAGKEGYYYVKHVKEHLDTTNDKAGRGWLNVHLDEWIDYVSYSDTHTATTNSFTFKYVPYGYYLITTSSGSTVSVNYNAPDQTVVDKNVKQPSDPTKTENKVTVTGGEVVTFTSTVKATNYYTTSGSNINPVLRYFVTDKWENGLKFNPANGIKSVTLVREDGSKVVINEDAEGDAQFELTNANTGAKGTYSLEMTEGANEFVLNVPWASYSTSQVTDEGGAAHTEVSFGASYYPSPVTIHVVYEMTVTDHIFDDPEDFSADNTLRWRYDVKDSSDRVVTRGGSDENEKKTTVYSIGFSLRKVTGLTEDDTPLNGAEFILYRDAQKKDAAGNLVYKDGNGDETTNATRTEGGQTVDNEPVMVVEYYHLNKNVDYRNDNPVTGTDEFIIDWNTNKDLATVLIADNSYHTMEIIGLPIGRYYLKEVLQPKGYDLPGNPFIIDIDADNDGNTGAYNEYSVVFNTNGNTEGIDYKKENAYLTVRIENGTSAVMPTTGGKGTVLLIGGGAFFFIAAAVVLVTKKRMYNEGR